MFIFEVFKFTLFKKLKYTYIFFAAYIFKYKIVKIFRYIKI